MTESRTLELSTPPYDFETGKLYHGDCVEVMSTMADESIDLTITSPPYDHLRAYKGYTFDFEKTADELFRITKQGGVVVWVVGDATIKGSETGSSFRQALYFKEIGFNLHDTMIYQKICYLPQNQHPRYSPTFEYMFVFCKGYPPKTFNPLQEDAKGGVSVGRGQRQITDEYRHQEKKVMLKGKKKRKTNIWSYATGGKIAGLEKSSHPATFPLDLVKDHILSWSNEGDVVLDPFVGSGTTCIVAKEHGRHFIGIDCAEEYLEIARKRIEDENDNNG